MISSASDSAVEFQNIVAKGIKSARNEGALGVLLLVEDQLLLKVGTVEEYKNK